MPRVKKADPTAAMRTFLSSASEPLDIAELRKTALYWEVQRLAKEYEPGVWASPPWSVSGLAQAAIRHPDLVERQERWRYGKRRYAYRLTEAGRLLAAHFAACETTSKNSNEF